MTLLTGFLQTIKQWDQGILFRINQVWQNDLFDAVLPWLRESSLWLPLYIFFVGFVFVNFGKRGFLWLLFFGLTIGICDQLSSTLIKHYFARVRPCNDPFMLQYIKLRLSHCPGGFSFTSSHATNHFGIAMFIHLTLSSYLKRKTLWLFAWAFSICYAQMYVGVHYPIDILGGTMMGLFAGSVSAWFFNRYIWLEKHPAPEVFAAKWSHRAPL